MIIGENQPVLLFNLTRSEQLDHKIQQSQQARIKRTESDLLKSTLEVKRALDDLVKLAKVGVNQATGDVGTASAISTDALNLNTETVTTATVLEAPEINTETSSYTPLGGTITGTSTSAVSLSGVYNGDQSDDNLFLKFTEDITVGGPYTGGGGAPKAFNVELRNASGLIETIEVTEEEDVEYSTSNGLRFSLSTGTLVNGDTFEFDVFENTPAAVDPDKAFNATGANRPYFEDGVSVTAGAFSINGTEITVNADDTINTVLQKITDSDANVTASFNAGGENVVLTQKSLGAGFDIVLGGDTSNFLAAVRLNPSTKSTSPLNIATRVGVTPTIVNSSEQINTETSSFTPLGGGITGDSTSLVSLTGVYNGLQGDEDLFLKFKDNVTIGVGTGAEFDVEVRNADGKIEEFVVTDEAGVEYTLSNGIKFSLSAGTVENGDTFEFEVKEDTPAAVDPDKAFNGTAGDRPNFEDGVAVTAGTFNINDIEITVDADDTINTVLQKITDSDANVTATFDPGTESVFLTQKTLGEDFYISLDSDTSNFLSAVKLDPGVNTAGTTEISGGTPTVIDATEINTETSSYTPLGGVISGASTVEVSLTGVYDGDQGDDDLFLKFKDNVTIGVGTGADFNVELRNAAGKIETVVVTDEAGVEYTLSNGLKFSLSAGTIEKDEILEFEVLQNTPAAVDPDKAFNGTGDNRPYFEDGVSVTAGVFTINDTDITVDADDTINTVLQKITDSDANVTASFNITGEKVVLTQKTIGEAFDITLGGDTSNFLDAVRLTTGTKTLGTDTPPDYLQPIDQVSSLSVIQTGNFSINGTDIAVDVTTDTLTDVIDRINNAGTGVIAVFDVDTKTIKLNSGDEFTLSNGTSNFFSGINIDTGEVGTTTTKTLGEEVLPDHLRPIDEVSSFSDIQTGNFSINGIDISVDVTSDSLTDVISRINNAGTDVTASFDVNSQKVSFSSENDFTLSNGTSNFFTGIKVNTGDVAVSEGAASFDFLESKKFERALDRFTGKLNKLMETSKESAEQLGEFGVTFIDDLKTSFEKAITSTFDSEFDGVGKVRSKFGFTFSFDGGDFLSFDFKGFKSSLGKQKNAFADFLLKVSKVPEDLKGGIDQNLNVTFQSLIDNLKSNIDNRNTTGLLVNLQA